MIFAAGYSWIAAVVVPIVISLLLKLLTGDLYADIRRVKEERIDFKAGVWVYVLLAISGLFFVWMGSWSFDPKWNAEQRWVIRGITLVMLMVCAVGCWWYAGCRIELDLLEIRIINRFKKQTMIYRNIREVRASNGYIVLDEGKVPRTVIPIIYGKAGLLFSLLKWRVATANDR